MCFLRFQRMTFSSAPSQPPPLRHRCLHRCWSRRKGKWSPGPGSCAGAFLPPGTDNRSISISASITFKKINEWIRYTERYRNNLYRKWTWFKMVSKNFTYFTGWTTWRVFGCFVSEGSPCIEWAWKLNKTNLWDFLSSKHGMFYFKDTVK